MHILILDDYQQACQQLSCRTLLADHQLTVLGDLSRDSRASAALAEAECLVLIRERTWIDAAFLRRTPLLRLISQTGPVGRHIDLEACNKAGVAVVQGTGAADAPAEFAWLLIMNAWRRLPAAIDAMRQGQWQVNLGREMRGQTLGILGFGKLGKIVARYAQAFGMQVQVWGSERARSEALTAGFFACSSRADFFSSSDVITVHLRLAESTRGSIQLSDLTMMKPDAVFVNTSRSELLASAALETALRQGRPGYAAIDVYESEPIYDVNHPFLQLPNLLCTPHLGYVAQQSYEAYFQSAFQNILQFCAGDVSKVVNQPFDPVFHS